MIEVQCNSCHTRYRIDEQVLPQTTPTFKCSRCGHVFSSEPRQREPSEAAETSRPTPPRTAGPDTEPPVQTGPNPVTAQPESSSAKPAPSAEQPPPDTEAGAAGASASAIMEDDLLSKSFRDDREDDTHHGENLSFDFHDELLAAEQESDQPGETVRQDDSWQVGEPESTEVWAQPHAIERVREGRVRQRAPKRPPAGPALDDDFVATETAPVYNRNVTHSARFFLGLFLIVALGWGGLAMLAHGAPAATADMLSTLPIVGQHFVPLITPARLVALRDVQTVYQPTKRNRTALVITGIAENVGTYPLHIVRVTASLRDSAERRLVNQAAYCGNNLSTKMVGEMTPHEVDFFQKLDPPKSFILDPSQTCPFVIVFVDPPPTTSRFDLSVTKAIASGGEQAPEVQRD